VIAVEADSGRVVVVLRSNPEATILDAALLPGLVYVFVYLGKRFGKRISLLALVALAGLVWLGDSLSGELVSKRFERALGEVQQYRTEPQEMSSTAIRLELWRSAIMVVKEHPFGLGEEGARAKALEWSDEGKIQKYVQPQLEDAHFHSDYLQQLAVAGYPGLLGLLLFYALLIRHFYRHRHQLGASMGLVVVFSYMISGLTDVPLYNRLTVFAFFVIITFCLVSIRHQQKVIPQANPLAYRSPAH
jgi:O-antigen ligase